MSRFRRLLTPALKDFILTSIPFRLWQRTRLNRKTIRFSLELTTKCNVKCTMCTRHDLVCNQKLTVTDLDPEILEKFLKTLKKFYRSGFDITVAPMGLGEPLIYPGLSDFVKKVKSVGSGIKIVLVTNGVLLNEKNSRLLLDGGVDEINISLNCANPSDYQKHMGLNAYQIVYQNIQNLLKIRNSNGSYRTSVGIQYLDYRGKPEVFNQEIYKWNSLMRGRDKCYVHPIVNQAGFSRTKTTVKKYAPFPCPAPATRLVIKKNGDAYPCDACLYNGDAVVADLLLGNIKTDDLYRIFTQPAGKSHQILNSMRCCDYSCLPTCRRCDTRYLNINYFFKLPLGLKIKNKQWL